MLEVDKVLEYIRNRFGALAATRARAGKAVEGGLLLILVVTNWFAFPPYPVTAEQSTHPFFSSTIAAASSTSSTSTPLRDSRSTPGTRLHRSTLARRSIA